nr:MAG TPA: hypothetical protein [Caudoviricetes sp.]
MHIKLSVCKISSFIRYTQIFSVKFINIAKEKRQESYFLTSCL